MGSNSKFSDNNKADKENIKWKRNPNFSPKQKFDLSKQQDPNFD